MVHNLVRCLADWLGRYLVGQCISSLLPMTLRTQSVEFCRRQSSTQWPLGPYAIFHCRHCLLGSMEQSALSGLGIGCQHIFRILWNTRVYYYNL